MTGQFMAKMMSMMESFEMPPPQPANQAATRSGEQVTVDVPRQSAPNSHGMGGGAYRQVNSLQNRNQGYNNTVLPGGTESF